MELTADFRITPAKGERAGAYASFPYDRELVRRFRTTFPRARWREEGCWFVPGVRAAQRLDRWMTQELEAIDRHADAKGRDDFEFDPLASDYLEAGDDLVVRTPWSRTVVAEMRAIAWARWDPLERVWRVPYRSVAELRRRWPAIEAAARRNEPEARLARAMARTPDPLARRREADRRKARYPVPIDDPPQLGVPVGSLCGVVVFEGSDGEIPSADDMAAYPFAAGAPERFVWAGFRQPGFRELRSLKPAAEPIDRTRGWWPPTEAEIDETRSRLSRAWRRREANL
jgi:hypothetical protein